MWEHDRCFWLISTAFDFRVPTKHCVTGVQAVGIETGQIIGQLILKSSHYTHFRSFSPKWNSDDGFDRIHRNPWLWGEICGSSEGRRCSLCGLPVEKLRLCRCKSHVFLDFWSGTLGIIQKPLQRPFHIREWQELFYALLPMIKLLHELSSRIIHLPHPKNVEPSENDIFQVIFWKITWF